MTLRIALDHYVYEDIYPAFKATTDEKGVTARINRAFLNFLAQRNQVLTGAAPLAVADIGSGPCDTLVMYLEQVPFTAGFEVRATDFLPAYTDSEHGEALKILAAAQTAQRLELTGFSAKAGDAFGGKLLDLLSGPRDGFRMRRAFRIVFASHMMYHAEGTADVQRMLADVADNLLAADGICIMYHLVGAPGTFQNLRARFGSEASAARVSNTGAVTIDDPPGQIAAACAALRLPLYEADFTTNLQMGTLGDKEWRLFKNPASYDELAASSPAAYEDLKRLYFVVQRAPRICRRPFPSRPGCVHGRSTQSDRSRGEQAAVARADAGVLPRGRRIGFAPEYPVRRSGERRPLGRRPCPPLPSSAGGSGLRDAAPVRCYVR